MPVLRLAKKARVDAVKALVTLSLFVLIYLTVDFHRVGRVLATVRWPDMAWAIVIFQIGILTRAYRWKTLLDLQDVRTPFGRLVVLYYVGMFFNVLLPSGFGGDVVKTYELSRQGPSGAVAASTVLMDRLMGLSVLFAMAAAALPFCWSSVPFSVAATLLGIIAGFILAAWLLLEKSALNSLAARVGVLRDALANETVAAFYDSLRRYSPKALLKPAAASLIFNLTLIASQTFLARASGVFIGFGYFFIFVPILSSLLALPISIGGLGVREGGYMLLLGKAGVPYERSLAMSLLFFSLTLMAGLMGGLIYFWQCVRGFGRASATEGK